MVVFGWSQLPFKTRDSQWGVFFLYFSVRMFARLSRKDYLTPVLSVKKYLRLFESHHLIYTPESTKPRRFQATFEFIFLFFECPVLGFVLFELWCGGVFGLIQNWVSGKLSIQNL